jgi:RNA polymerase sigma-70 factor, ECF subfamily
MTLSTAVRIELPRTEAEEQRFDALLATNAPALTRLAATYTNTSSDRDDLFQEIAVALWQALPRFRGECSERTFLFRVAHNRAIDYLRRHKTVGQTAADEMELRDSRPDPETGFAREQQGQRLRDAIHRLPLPYKQVITLLLEEMQYSEIAQVLGISETNAGVRINRARQLLRKLLEEHK